MNDLAEVSNPSRTLEAACKVPVHVGQRGITLHTLEELYRFAKAVSLSGLAPRGMEKPESILVAIQLGLELGLSPMSALQNIAVINGRPGVYGDAALALVRGSGMLDEYHEQEIGEPGKDSWGYRISGRRRGFEPAEPEEFTVADAKRADLWGKAGPWKQYPQRMLRFRARSFFLRDNFGDVLKGLRTVEELQDYPAQPKAVEAEAAPPAAGRHSLKGRAKPPRPDPYAEVTPDAVGEPPPAAAPGREPGEEG